MSSSSTFKVMMIGDVFGRPGRTIIEQSLPKLIQTHQIDAVVANGENAAGGKGLTPDTATQLWDAGVDVITLGNHTFDQKSIIPVLNQSDRVIRPWNMDDNAPGKGYTLLKKGQDTLAVVNIMGTVFMPHNISPFPLLEGYLKELHQHTRLIVVDMHAEITGEKRAMGHALDGKVSAVVGTHTHVPTADEEILPGGTGYVTDLGMTGPYDSVIGIKKEIGIQRFMTGQKSFEVAKENTILYATVFEIDKLSGKTISVFRIKKQA